MTNQVKHEGKCPECRKTIMPIIEEKNNLRRDKCSCPECHAVLYVCRSPGCDDYALGSDLYDNEFCPACTKAMATKTGEVLSEVKDHALPIVLTVIGGVLAAKFSGEKE